MVTPETNLIRGRWYTEVGRDLSDCGKDPRLEYLSILTHAFFYEKGFREAIEEVERLNGLV